MAGPAYADDAGYAEILARDPALGAWPLVFLVDDAGVVKGNAAFLWSTFTRYEPAGDTWAAQVRLRRHHPSYAAPVVLDCRMKPGYPAELVADEAVADSTATEAEIFQERYKVPYGATISVRDGDPVNPGDIPATWDPHTHPIVTEVAGRVRFHEFIDGVTVNEHVDDITGLTSLVVTDPKQRGSAGKDLRPMISLADEKGKDLFLAGDDLAAYRAREVGFAVVATTVVLVAVFALCTILAAGLGWQVREPFHPPVERDRLAGLKPAFLYPVP